VRDFGLANGIGEMMTEQKKGYTYTVSQEQIDEYRKWPLDRRLKWLFQANKMRKFLPKKTIEIQEAFRQAKI
jgi:hypothetical protein